MSDLESGAAAGLTVFHAGCAVYGRMSDAAAASSLTESLVGGAMLVTRFKLEAWDSVMLGAQEMVCGREGSEDPSVTCCAECALVM